MNDTALFDQITAKLRLKSEATLALVCIDEFLTNFFTPNDNVNLEQLFNKLPSDVSKMFIDMFLRTAITPENKLAFKARAEALAEKIKACRVIQMTIAFQPDETAVAVFSDWIKKNVSVDTIIDLQFDQSIVGGAQIVYGGMYKDFSVRKHLAGRFQIQREEIMNMLK